MSDEALQLDPASCALIIQDMQNDVIIEGGAFADSGTPAERHAAARSATLATAFWAIAWAGAPESANAPPSMMTSFCRS